ncbi:phosphopantothenate--cysteine ligase 2 isoform X1 [Selaginella moellendorffii]|uniref:phosphopantothenate--cysteine ligase 2 isoform X1 n=1 Tax=Selaginella moellendorffii TaxID=88036 RepID=UPI000D1C6055|nr:phosphopantothenate--cysteine ligase 2 isoform X1 [Selaginella moellendorffii]|eukprot:XP_024532504.1 phosphopantothenate--cysteine ligase 2 isoform X1 [Selaginella moellendorffii]
MKPVGRHAMFYFAAAVSDFYVPWNSMMEHKIQSDDGSMTMQLAPVPKMLGLLRKHWAPEAFCVSFKVFHFLFTLLLYSSSIEQSFISYQLETDVDILLKKVRSSLCKYGMHAVVGNELDTRKNRVVIVTRKVEMVLEKGDCSDIELPLVNFLVGHVSPAATSMNLAAAREPCARPIKSSTGQVHSLASSSLSQTLAGSQVFLSNLLI